jgi:uroporphyrinogen-III decarboxylase
VAKQFYLDLARSGLRMPIAADLVLHEQADPEQVLTDGRALGKVVEEAARRYRTPLAFCHMNLTLEKSVLLEVLGVPTADVPLYHFADVPAPDALSRLKAGLARLKHPHLQAQIESVRYIAAETDLVPVGMSIGPFSLMTKLLADPITALYLAGSGVTSAEDPEVARLEATLALASEVVLHSVVSQVAAGAKAIFIAEPAANVVYISPRQIEAGSDLFERYATAPNLQVKEVLGRSGVDLIFHCCGELNPYMVRQFTTLEPVILSLGSSRVLWEDAAIVPKQIVLYGNLPSKHFYSDEVITVAQVETLACELIGRMRAVGHPFILGTECDVLDVPGATAAITRKVDAFVRCRCD